MKAIVRSSGPVAALRCQISSSDSLVVLGCMEANGTDIDEHHGRRRLWDSDQRV